MNESLLLLFWAVKHFELQEHVQRFLDPLGDDFVGSILMGTPPDWASVSLTEEDVGTVLNAVLLAPNPLIDAVSNLSAERLWNVGSVIGVQICMAFQLKLVTIEQLTACLQFIAQHPKLSVVMALPMIISLVRDAAVSMSWKVDLWLYVPL